MKKSYAHRPARIRFAWRTMHPRRPALRQRADDHVVVAHAQAGEGIGALLLEPPGHREALPTPARRQNCRPLRAVVRLGRRRRALHGRRSPSRCSPTFPSAVTRQVCATWQPGDSGSTWRIRSASSMRTADYGRSCVRCEISCVREHSITQNTSPRRRHIRWHRCIKTCALITVAANIDRCCQVSGQGYAGTSGHGA